MKNKINFKQPKYMLPAILYPLLIGAGWLIIDLFQTEVEEEDHSGLQTTEYLNSDLPSAHLKEDIGSKRDNMQRSFGNIRDLSAVETLDNDRDSLNKKEEYESKYSEDETAVLQEQESLKRLQEMQARLQQQASSNSRMRNDDDLLSAEDRRLLEQMRRRRLSGDMQGDLSLQSQEVKTDTLSVTAVSESEDDKKAVKALDDDAENIAVVKKVRETSSYFNTLSEESSDSRLIKAIIDEEIKAVSGSRVRLRLLDAIEIDGVVMKKGTYLYATLSGFSNQRVKGKIESVLVGDELYKIGLSMYDLDGLEGLYVPSSAFRETAKDVAGSVTQGSMSVNPGDNRNSITQWAGQALQNAYQQTSNAISKAIKKNRVRLKYGTQVYLVNRKDKRK